MALAQSQQHSQWNAGRGGVVPCTQVPATTQLKRVGGWEFVTRNLCVAAGGCSDAPPCGISPPRSCRPPTPLGYEGRQLRLGQRSGRLLDAAAGHDRGLLGGSGPHEMKVGRLREDSVRADARPGLQESGASVGFVELCATGDLTKSGQRRRRARSTISIVGIAEGVSNVPWAVAWAEIRKRLGQNAEKDKCLQR